MDFTYFMLSVAASLCTGTICAFLYRAILRPSGWAKKDGYGAFEKRYAVKVEQQPEPLGTVTTH